MHPHWIASHTVDPLYKRADEQRRPSLKSLKTKTKTSWYVFRFLGSPIASCQSLRCANLKGWFMTSTRFTHSVKAMAALALLVTAASQAQAATWNFGVGNGCTEAAANSGNFGNTFNCTGAIPSATATAWSTTGSGASFAIANLAPNGTTGGFGVKNQNAAEGLTAQPPEHALDNNGQTDLMMLSFAANSPVNLTSINLGYKSGDADISVLRYTGSSQPASISGKTIGTGATGLLAAGSGWELVGSYANLIQGNNALNTGGKSSSWWLISAYNVGYGVSGTGNGSASAAANFDATADYVKILAVAGTPTNGNNAGVPEPGSLALVGAALSGILVVRRRASAAA